MPGPTTRSLALLVVLTTLALLVGSSADAKSPRIARGDAQAVFEAALTGGAAILLHGGPVTGPNQRDVDDGVRINAFAPWDGLHYCALDWHVISINLVDGNFPGETRTRQEVGAALSTADVTWLLNGTSLELSRTPVRPALDSVNLGLIEGFYFTAGRVLAPAELTAGPHTLRIVVTDAGGLVFDSQITFFVDAAGTGACL